MTDTLRTNLAANLRKFEAIELAETALKRAAVAIVVGPGAIGPALLLTRRNARLRGHAGQWAFPGGRLDEGETPFEAAIREVDEELGLTLSDTHLLGRLDDYETRSGYAISPFVFWSALEPLTPNPDEVASVHPIPLEDIERGGPPVLLEGPEPDRPIIRLLFGEHQVHAPTGAILHQFHEVAVRGRPTRVAHFDQPDWAR